MGMVKHGDGKVIETTEVPVFHTECNKCGKQIEYEPDAGIPSLCDTCKKEEDQEK